MYAAVTASRTTSSKNTGDVASSKSTRILSLSLSFRYPWNPPQICSICSTSVIATERGDPDAISRFNMDDGNPYSLPGSAGNGLVQNLEEKSNSSSIQSLSFISGSDSRKALTAETVSKAETLTKKCPCFRICSQTLLNECVGYAPLSM